jgi:hypothetical protein
MFWYLVCTRRSGSRGGCRVCRHCFRAQDWQNLPAVSERKWHAGEVLLAVGPGPTLFHLADSKCGSMRRYPAGSSSSHGGARPASVLDALAHEPPRHAALATPSGHSRRALAAAAAEPPFSGHEVAEHIEARPPQLPAFEHVTAPRDIGALSLFRPSKDSWHATEDLEPVHAPRGTLDAWSPAPHAPAASLFDSILHETPLAARGAAGGRHRRTTDAFMESIFGAEELPGEPALLDAIGRTTGHLDPRHLAPGAAGDHQQQQQRQHDRPVSVETEQPGGNAKRSWDAFNALGEGVLIRCYAGSNRACVAA